MTDLATLDVVVKPSGVDVTDAQLQKLTSTGAGTEAQVTRLSRAAQEMASQQAKAASAVSNLEARMDNLRASIDPTFTAQRKLDAELKEATSLYRMGAISANEYATATRVLDSRLDALQRQQSKNNGLHTSGAGAAKLQAYQLQNLAFQANDVFVGLTSGQKPLTVLMQQGSQIGQIFGTSGMGMGAIFKQLGGIVGGVVTKFLPVGIAVGVAAAAFGLFNRAVNDGVDEKKLIAGLNLTKEQMARVKDQTISMGDTFKATMEVIGDRIMHGPIGDGIKWLGGVFSKFFDWLSTTMGDVASSLIGHWYAIYKTIVTNWQNLPAAFGAIIKGTVNTFLDGIEVMINGAIGGINKVIGMANKIPGVKIGSLGTVDTGHWEASTKADGDYNTFRAQGEAAAKAWGTGFLGDVRKRTISDFLDGVKKQAGDANKGPKGAADKKSEAEKEYERQVKAAEAYIKTLTKETAEIGMSTYAKKAWEVQTAASLAPTEALKNKILELGKAWEMATLSQEIMKASAESLGKAMDMARIIDHDNALLDMNIKQKTIDAAKQDMINAGITEGTLAYQAYGKAILDAAAAKGQKLLDIDNAEKYLELMTDIDTTTQQAAQSMSTAFGTVGQALGNLTTVLTGYAKTQADIEAKRRKDLNSDDPVVRAQANAKASKASAQAEIQSYGDMAAAAKGFFNEKSTGYKVLQIAEQTFRAIEFAMSLRSITMKGMEMAAHLLGVSTKVASVPVVVAADAATAASGTAAGAGRIFAALGPFGFPVVAAMLAVMAGLGIAAMSGGGGVATPDTSVVDGQKKVGTGSVLGDANAKSDSIAKSLDIVAKNTNTDLEYSNQMLISLRAIANSINTVAAAIAGQLGVGGSLDTSKLGLGTSGKPATLGNLGFGSTTTKSLKDQGIDFQAQSLNDLINQGASGNNYQTTESNTTKKAFGITYSNKTSTDTTTSAIDGEMSRQIGDLVGSLKSGVLEAAKVLGINGAGAALDSFQVALGKLSFKDMTGEEIQAQLNALFSKLGDDMASAAYAGVDKLRKVGEGSMETLVRLAREYQVVDVTMKSLGKTFDLVGASSIEARDRLVQLAGGLDDFAASAQFFSENFMSDAERAAPIMSSVREEMARLGYYGITTKDQFKQLVLGLDVTTEAGATAYAALMKVAPAFAKADDYIVSLGKAVEDAQSQVSDAQSAYRDAQEAVTSAVDRARDAINKTLDPFKQFVDTFGKFLEKLDKATIDALNPQLQYAASKAIFEETRAAARNGDTDAMAKLPDTMDNFIAASKDYQTDELSYVRDIAYVRTATEEALDYSQKQVDAGQLQLDALDAQLTSLGIINTSVLSVSEAVNNLAVAQNNVAVAMGNLQAAQDAQAAARAALGATGADTPSVTPSAPATAAPEALDYSANGATNSYVMSMGAARVIADWNAKPYNFMQEYNNFKNWAPNGIQATLENMNQYWHVPSGTAQDLAARYGLPQFAKGAVVTRPTIALFGEAGDEAAMPITRTSDGKMAVHSVGGGSKDAEIAQLRKELAEANQLTNDALIAIAVTNQRMIEMMEKWDGRGVLVRNDEDQPLFVDQV